MYVIKLKESLCRLININDELEKIITSLLGERYTSTLSSRMCKTIIDNVHIPDIEILLIFEGKVYALKTNLEIEEITSYLPLLKNHEMSFGTDYFFLL